MKCYKFLILSSFLLAVSCQEIKTDEPQLAYKYWSGETPTKDLNIQYAEYWKSAHWSYEYEFYMKFKPTEKWWENFIKRKNLIKDMSSTSTFKNPPFFFHPTKSCIQYRPFEQTDDSRYYRDTLNGVCYIHEIQL